MKKKEESSTQAGYLDLTFCKKLFNCELFPLIVLTYEAAQEIFTGTIYSLKADLFIRHEIVNKQGSFLAIFTAVFPNFWREIF